MDVSPARNDSSASPLMLLANLSLLSPAIPLPGSALTGMKPRLGLMTKDIWSESHSPPPSTSFRITASPRRSSKSPTSPVSIARRSEVTDSLAALAAAAARPGQKIVSVRMRGRLLLLLSVMRRQPRGILLYLPPLFLHRYLPQPFRHL